jgi:hypothetical protein
MQGQDHVDAWMERAAAIAIREKEHLIELSMNSAESIFD